MARAMFGTLQERDIELSCTVPFLGEEQCSDVTVLLLLFYI